VDLKSEKNEKIGGPQAADLLDLAARTFILASD
jgi:hypothetical protein